jgi:cyclophilin family peptidyl-prolyl cis-trans isomerase
MASDGRNANGSQFYITLAKSDAIEMLTARHVAFGYIISGMRVVKRIQAMGQEDGTPTAKVVIVDCGKL